MTGVSEFVEFVSAHVSVRPRRLGYVVRGNSRVQFRSAIAYATTEWGGMGHPIVAAGKRNRILSNEMALLEILQPEVLVDFAELGEPGRAEIEAQTGIEVLDPESPTFRHAEPGVHSLVIPVGAVTARSAIQTAMEDSALLHQIALGVIPANQRDFYTNITGASLVTPTESVRIFNAQISKSSAIGLTTRSFPAREVQGSSGDPLIVVCSSSLTLAQARYFWNVRACTVPILGQGEVLILRGDDLRDPRVQEGLREKAYQKLQSRPDLFLVSSNEAEATQLGIAAGFKLHTGKIQSAVWFAQARDYEKDPLTFIVNFPPGRLTPSRRLGGQVTDIPLVVTKPTARLHLDSPIRFDLRHGGRVRLDVRGVPQVEWPRIPEIASLIADGAEYSPHGLSLIRSPQQRYEIDLRIPGPKQVLTAALESRGWQWSESDKGRYANALVPNHGQLERISLLQRELVHQIVHFMSSLSRHKSSQALDRLLTTQGTENVEQLLLRIAGFGLQRWLTANEIASGVGGSRAAILSPLEELIEASLVYRAIRRRCPRCSLLSVVRFREADDGVSCSGCGTTSPLRGPKDAEPEFVYAINSLLDRALDQDCVSHMFALAWAYKHEGAQFLVPGANISGPRKAEVDLLGISHNHLIVGEIKSLSGAFTLRVIRDTLNLALELGATYVIVGSPDEWQEHTLQNATREANRRSLTLNVLSRDRLFTT